MCVYSKVIKNVENLNRVSHLSKWCCRMFNENLKSLTVGADNTSRRQMGRSEGVRMLCSLSFNTWAQI
jgi:hypothetical protein